MALAEKAAGGAVQPPRLPIVDHRTWVFVGDGCLMEGISHEACVARRHAGPRQADRLYDDNGISIDGKVAGWFADDTPKRFEAYGWHVIRDVDGQDGERWPRDPRAQADTKRPSLICCKHRNRLSGADARRHREGARRAAGRRRSRRGAQAPGLDRSAVRRAGQLARRLGLPRAGPRGRAGLAGAVRALSRAAFRSSRRNSCGACRASCRRSGRRCARSCTRGGGNHRLAGDARVLAERAQRDRRWTAGAAGRLGRPDRLQQHDAQGRARHHARRCVRQLHALRRARVRHDRGHERHRAARRLAFPSAAPS
jgi:hypothetical protein